MALFNHRSVEKLDLDRGAWAPVGNMLVRRSTLGVAVLGDKLYAVGGFDGTNGLETVERFDPCKLKVPCSRPQLAVRYVRGEYMGCSLGLHEI